MMDKHDRIASLDLQLIALVALTAYGLGFVASDLQSPPLKLGAGGLLA